MASDSKRPVSLKNAYFQAIVDNLPLPTSASKLYTVFLPGCGNDPLAELIHRRFSTVNQHVRCVGLDPDESAINRAQKMAQEGQVEFYPGDAANLVDVKLALTGFTAVERLMKEDSSITAAKMPLPKVDLVVFSMPVLDHSMASVLRKKHVEELRKMIRNFKIMMVKIVPQILKAGGNVLFIGCTPQEQLEFGRTMEKLLTRKIEPKKLIIRSGCIPLSHSKYSFYQGVDYKKLSAEEQEALINERCVSEQEAYQLQGSVNRCVALTDQLLSGRLGIRVAAAAGAAGLFAAGALTVSAAPAVVAGTALIGAAAVLCGSMSK